MYANIVIDTDASLSQAFTYHVPEEIEDIVSEGMCVAVPFSGRELVGYILELGETAPYDGEIKNISALIPDACALTPSLMRLAQSISDRYVSTLAHSVRAIMPEVMSATISSMVHILDPDKAARTSPNQQRILEVLAALGGEVDADILKARCRIEKFGPALRQLRSRGAVEVVRTLELPKARPLTVRALKMVDDDFPGADDMASRAPKQAAIVRELAESEGAVRQADILRKVGSSSGPVRSLIDKGLVEKVNLRVRRRPFGLQDDKTSANLELTPIQKNALEVVSRGIRSGSPQTTLLHGVTGSGKTEVYIRSIQEVLDRDGGCIVLVPEISLTTHLMETYASRFGDAMAVLHSKLSVGERHDEWRRIESGEARVVLGPRSAVFAPVRDLGLVVMDEEHEPSYKQEHSPKYNARYAAEERASIESASVILGSATPSVETFHRAASGVIKLATMDRRIDDRPMPVVHSVDLREEFEQGRKSFFSARLEEAIAERLSRKEQVILFVNRRGYASFILCRTCGYTAKCKNCAVSLTYHAAQRLLRCHHCDASHPAPTLCPNCQGTHIKQFGVGTERVEAEAMKVFPDASVIRMDSDTTRRKGAHSALLNEFRSGKADIMVGTQMIAKGLDFPNVTLVGVISADTTLNLPDFRSAERTFQLLTQVSGRAGRGLIPGEVVVQSFSPDHYAIEASAGHDYARFYEQEIAYREELSYPPFSRLVNIVSSDPMHDYAESRLRELAAALERCIPSDSVDMLGPAEAPISKLKGLHRWHLLLRNRGESDLPDIVRECLNELPLASRQGLSIDVDPMTML